MTQFDFVDTFKKWIIDGKITDAPELYIEMAALQVLAMCVKRKAYVRFGERWIYPNLWIMLVGKSRVMRKSTCLRFAEDFIRTIDADCIYPNSFSVESIQRLFQEKSQGIFLIEEFMNLKTAMDKQYASGVQGLFTDMYDKPFPFYRLLVSYQVYIQNHFLNIFCCTTPASLQKYATEDDIHIGFLPRFLLCYANKKDRFVAFPQSGDPVLKGKLLDMAKYCSLSAGYEMSFDNDAMEILKEFSEDTERRIKFASNTITPFFSELFIYCIKFAILYHISSPLRNIPIINDEDIERSIKLAKIIRESTERVIDNLAFDNHQRARQRVLEALLHEKYYDENNKHIGCTRTQLISDLRMPSMMLSRIIGDLSEEGLVKIDAHHKSVNAMRPTTMYYLTEKITNKEVG